MSIDIDKLIDRLESGLHWLVRGSVEYNDKYDAIKALEQQQKQIDELKKHHIGIVDEIKRIIELTRGQVEIREAMANGIDYSGGNSNHVRVSINEHNDYIGALEELLINNECLPQIHQMTNHER